MTPYFIALALLLVSCISHAQDTEGRPVVMTLNPLLEKAVATGEAHGILGGPIAEKMQSMGQTQPIEVEVKAIGLFHQSDCKELEITMTQRQVMIPGHKHPHDRRTDWHMPYCAGGALPATKEGAQLIKGTK